MKIEIQQCHLVGCILFEIYRINNQNAFNLMIEKSFNTMIMINK